MSSEKPLPRCPYVRAANKLNGFVPDPDAKCPVLPHERREALSHQYQAARDRLVVDAMVYGVEAIGGPIAGAAAKFASRAVRPKTDPLGDGGVHLNHDHGHTFDVFPSW